ncbi:MAG: hypothetical protein SVM80_07385 [Halobacteriota archaeon]|nr:hypothetical protein [Halobacteriota archaeon]
MNLKRGEELWQKKPLLICIVGIDGSGKTTQANMLLESLREEGVSCRYTWLRFHHLLSLPILAYARAMGLSEMKTLDGGGRIGYHYFYRSSFVSNLYPFFLFADTLIFTTLKIHMPMILFGKTIACDRFIHDTIVDLMISTGDIEIYKSSIGKLFLKLIPKDARVVMLKVDENILIERRREIGQDKTLDKRIELYDRISDEFGLPVVDTKSSIGEVHEELIKKVGLVL